MTAGDCQAVLLHDGGGQCTPSTVHLRGNLPIFFDHSQARSYYSEFMQRWRADTYPLALLISGLPLSPFHSRAILVPVSEVAPQLIPPQIFAIEHFMCSSIQLTSSISFIHRSIPSKDQRLVMSYTKRIPWWKKIRKFHSRQNGRETVPP